MLRRFQFVFLFTWQSATYQIIKKSSQHRILCHSIMRADFWLTATDCRFFKGWSILSNERPNSITATDYWRVTILSSWCFTTHIYICIYIYVYVYLVGRTPTPLKKYESQLGWWHSQYMEKKTCSKTPTRIIDELDNNLNQFKSCWITRFIVTLWLFNMAMENDPCIDHFELFTYSNYLNMVEPT